MSILSSPKNTPTNLNDPKTFQDLQKQIILQDTENFQAETDKLRGFTEEIAEMLSLMKKFKQISQLNIIKLDKQIEDINRDLRIAQNQLQNFKKKHLSEKQEMAQLNAKYGATKKKRCAIADTINTKLLSQIKMEDRKSQAHDVFKWVINTIYKEPPSKYYWDNFIEQAFKNDRGSDFKQRMGRMSAAQLKEDERVATQKLLAIRNELVNCPEFSKAEVKEDINKIFEIAALILEGSEISRRSKQVDALDMKNKDQEILMTDAIQKLNNKVSAIRDRIVMNEKYQRVLQSLEGRLQNKGNVYQEVANEGQRIIRDLKENRGSTMTPSTPTAQREKNEQTPPLAYNTETDKRDICTCLMF